MEAHELLQSNGSAPNSKTHSKMPPPDNVNGCSTTLSHKAAAVEDLHPPGCDRPTTNGRELADNYADDLHRHVSGESAGGSSVAGNDHVCSSTYTSLDGVVGADVTNRNGCTCDVTADDSGNVDHRDRAVVRSRVGTAVLGSISLETAGSDADVSSLSSLEGADVGEGSGSVSYATTSSAGAGVGGGGVIENLKRLSGYRRLQSSAGSSTFEQEDGRQSSLASLGDDGAVFVSDTVTTATATRRDTDGLDSAAAACCPERRSSSDAGRRQSLPPQTLDVVTATMPVGGHTVVGEGSGQLSSPEVVQQHQQPPLELAHYRNGTSGGVSAAGSSGTFATAAATPGSPEAVLQLNGGNTPAAVQQQGRQFPVEDVHEFNCASAASVTCELKMTSVQPVATLQAELKKAHEDLKLRDEEVGRLKCLRDEVGAELEDLTASLFQEAHKMVREAKVKGDTAEKALKEANMKIEVLQAEVQALKTLVITSTPSMPNRHLHPQLDSKNHKENGEKNGVTFLRGHKRSPSHNNLKYGRETTPPGSPVKEPPPQPLARLEYEVDPIYHNEFVSWKEAPCVNKEHPFLARIYREDIIPCLSFTNTELAKDMEKALEENAIVIETVSGKNPFPKRCAMLDTPRLCKYRMKLGDSEQWHYISQLCRNRIAAACDFLCYLRYIEQGLVKSSIHEVYGEILRLRKQMAVAKLGLN